MRLYYRPTVTRENRANNYGPLPPYESTRNEGFIKCTLTPIQSVLLNVSYRGSHRLDKATGIFGESTAATAGTGSETWQRIATVDGSWVVNDRSHLTFKWTYFANPTSGRPDNESSAVPSTALGTALPITALTTQGRLQVPVPVAGQTAHNTFIQPLIDQYGFIRPRHWRADWRRFRGYGLEFNDQDFFRKGGQIAYNYMLGTTITHELHAGLQWYTDSEDLVRRSNGWGAISVPGGRLNFQGTPIFYTAEFSQQAHRHAADPFGISIDQHRVERQHPMEPLVVQRRPGHEQRPAARTGPEGRRVGALRIRVSGGEHLQDV